MSGNANADIRNPVMFSRSCEQGMGGGLLVHVSPPFDTDPRRAPVLVAAVACVGQLRFA